MNLGPCIDKPLFHECCIWRFLSVLADRYALNEKNNIENGIYEMVHSMN